MPLSFDGRRSETWPAESALVRFEVVPRGHRRGRLSGLGDFRALRQEEP